MVEDWELDLDPAAFLGVRPLARATFPGAACVAAVQGAVPAGFLSNMNAFQWEANYEGMPLTDAFAYRFLSFELGLVKPDPPSSTPWRPAPGPRGRVLFLDDNAVNVEAARGGVRGLPCPWRRRRPRCAGGGGRARNLRPARARRRLGAGRRACANMPPWLPTARCCVSCRASTTTSPSSGPPARTACCASCAATPAGSSSTRPARCARAVSRATWRPRRSAGGATSRPSPSTTSSGSRAATPTSSPGSPSTSSPTSA